MIAHPHRLAMALLTVVLVVWLGAMAWVDRPGGFTSGLLASGASLPMCGHAGPGAPFATDGGGARWAR
jgi:hypothetical protein